LLWFMVRAVLGARADLLLVLLRHSKS
jgi:hypothetical protein